MLIGVGEANEPAEAIDLMTVAAQRAIADSGARKAKALPLDAVIVPRGSWPYEDPGKEIARRLGAPEARSILGDLGVSQQGLISAALHMIVVGDAEVVLVVGGESRRWSATGGYVTLGGVADLTLQRPLDFVDELEVAAGIAFPAVRSYALLQRAFDHQMGWSEEEAATSMNTLWSSMSHVAANTGAAAFAAPVDQGFLGTEGPENRRMAAPYLKWHCSQWNVDDAAALVMCSKSAALRLGLEPSAALHPHVALESTHALPVIRRDQLSRWPAMELLGQRAAAHLACRLGVLDIVDLYSCFPVAVMIQSLELGIPLEPAPTLTGGMTFAGGPFNNYALSSHVTAAQRLRSKTGSLGLITTVSGLLTKPGLGVWSTEPPHQGLLLADLCDDAARTTRSVNCVPFDAHSNLVIESSTAFEDNERLRSVVIGRDEEGQRHLAVFDDETSFHRFTEASCIGEELR